MATITIELDTLDADTVEAFRIAIEAITDLMPEQAIVTSKIGA